MTREICIGIALSQRHSQEQAFIALAFDPAPSDKAESRTPTITRTHARTHQIESALHLDQLIMIFQYSAPIQGAVTVAARCTHQHAAVDERVQLKQLTAI
jgi:hypothetical protein